MEEINIKNLMIILAVIIIPIVGILVVNQYNKPESKINSLLNNPVPDFSLADRVGNNYSNSNLKGKNVVLFFSEGLSCYPACWNQMAAFANDERFNNSDTVVLSVVLDSPSDWQKVMDKMAGIDKAKIVFDNGGQVSKKFGMLTVKSSMRYGSFPGHTYVIIDKKGVVRYVYDDSSMAVRNDQIIAELKKLK